MWIDKVLETIQNKIFNFLKKIELNVFQFFTRLTPAGRQIEFFVHSKDFVQLVSKTIPICYPLLSESEYSQMFTDAGRLFFQKQNLDTDLIDRRYFKILRDIFITHTILKKTELESRYGESQRIEKIRAKVLACEKSKDLRFLENMLDTDEIKFLEYFYDTSVLDELLYLTERGFKQKPNCQDCGQPLKFISYFQGYNPCICRYSWD